MNATMIDEAARAAFEKCCTELGIGFESTQPFQRDSGDDGYLHFDVDNAWRIWSAARAESARTPADVVDLANKIKESITWDTDTARWRIACDALDELVSLAAMQPVQVDVEARLLPYIPKKLRFCSITYALYGETSKGEMRVCDLRGFDHLTGHEKGQHGLSPGMAWVVWGAIGRRIVDAWNLTPMPDAKEGV